MKANVLAKASTKLLDTPYSIQDDVTNHVMPEVFMELEERDFSPGIVLISFFPVYLGHVSHFKRLKNIFHSSLRYRRSFSNAVSVLKRSKSNFASPLD